MPSDASRMAWQKELDQLRDKPSFANALGWSGLGICRLLQRSVDRFQQKL